MEQQWIRFQLLATIANSQQFLMTRVWEFQDNNAIPSDLVREQDFILQVRRMQRVNTPHLVINLVLQAIEPLAKSRRAFEAVQDSLRAFAKVTNAIFADMSNGDVFLVWEKPDDAKLLLAQLVDVMMPGRRGAPKKSSKYLLTYNMPADYAQLRERANHYIEVVRTASALPADSAVNALKSEAARGPLTTWSADQIGKLLNEIDLRRYSRTQPIYRRGADGSWTPICEEYFISIEDLRRERFPKLEIITPEHLFLALCETLDHLPAVIAGKKLSIHSRPFDSFEPVGRRRAEQCVCPICARRTASESLADLFRNSSR